MPAGPGMATITFLIYCDRYFIHNTMYCNTRTTKQYYVAIWLTANRKYNVLQHSSPIIQYEYIAMLVDYLQYVFIVLLIRIIEMSPFPNLRYKLTIPWLRTGSGSSISSIQFWRVAIKETILGAYRLLYISRPCKQ